MPSLSQGRQLLALASVLATMAELRQLFPGIR